MEEYSTVVKTNNNGCLMKEREKLTYFPTL